MTSRRAFLGLFAAAPFVAPAAIKAAAETRYISGSTAGWTDAIITAPKLSLSSFGQCRNFSIDVLDLSELEVDTAWFAAQCEPLEVDVPNRLYGARVTAEGDAI